MRAVPTVADEGLLAVYRRLARADDGKLDGLGPALATKVLYFCQPRPTDMTALILDDLVAFWLDCKVTFRLEPVSWSARNQRRTLGSANDLGARPVGRAGGGVKPAGLQMAGQPLTLGLKSAYTPLGFASQTQAWRM